MRGSFVGNREDMAESLAFAAAGKVKADIELEPLADINSVFERLEHGKVAARVVLDFAPVSAAATGQSVGTSGRRLATGRA